MVLANFGRFLAPALAAGLIMIAGGCGDTGSNDGEPGATTEVAEASSGAETGEKLPNDLPKNLPVLSLPVYSVSDSDAGEWSFILESLDPKSEIQVDLKEDFSKDGWTIKSDIDLGSAGGEVKATNGEYDVRVTYTPNPQTRDSDVPSYMVAYKVETITK